MLERGAVLGLDHDLAGALDQPAVEVDVVDQVLGAGQRRPVRGRAGAQPARRRPGGVVVLGRGDPRGADVRARVRGTRPRGRPGCSRSRGPSTLEKTARSARSGQAELDAVVRAGARRRGPLARAVPVTRRSRLRERSRGRHSGAVGAVRAEPDQAVPQPGARAGRGRPGRGSGGSGRGPCAGTRRGLPRGSRPGLVNTVERWSTIRRNRTGRQRASSGWASRSAKTRSYWSKMSKCLRLVVPRMLPWRRCR